MIHGEKFFNPATKRYGATVYSVSCERCGWARGGFATEARALAILGEHGTSCVPHADVVSADIMGPVAVLKQEQRDGQTMFVVSAVYTGADRTDGYGISTGPNLKLAQRLARAIDAGVVFGPASIRVDVNGKSYVSSTCKVSGRTLNADLRRLGF